MAVVKIVELIVAHKGFGKRFKERVLAEAAKTIKNIKSVYMKWCNAKYKTKQQNC